MGNLGSTIFVTLDGVYQAPGGPEEDTRDGFEQGGRSFPLADDDFGRFVTGRRTYDIFASYWPKVTDPGHPIAGRLNALPKYVVSHSLRAPAWPGTTVVPGDLAKEITALKERTDGELQIHGFALVRSLLDLRLVDTLHLLTFPVVLGHRLFTGGAVPHDVGDGPEYGTFELPEEDHGASGDANGGGPGPA
ncbi:dihydrofolate reductase family protein [Streptomyces sp. NPDC088760]|uniref:dihydrofolate reductase family protein n=1 Tax=Streptomyces sp. NPDC088760 TaxID=3365890 RepID=UPI0038062561